MRLSGPEPVNIVYTMPRASLPKVAIPFLNVLFCQAMHPLDFSTQGWSRFDVLRISNTPNLAYGTLCGNAID